MENVVPIVGFGHFLEMYCIWVLIPQDPNLHNGNMLKYSNALGQLPRQPDKAEYVEIFTLSHVKL